MELTGLLESLGIGLATNGIYDVLKKSMNQAVSKAQFSSEIQSVIDLHGVKMSAETVIEALTRDGHIVISDSHLQAQESLVFGSVDGAAVVMGNSKLSTNRTSIELSGTASLHTAGNAQVRQNSDGSISFHTGGIQRTDFNE